MSDRLPRPEPREAFKRTLRSQLMAQAPTALVQREAVWSRFQRGFVRPAFALGAVLLVLLAGAGKAAADSLPGDAAFGLKVAAEELQLTFAFDDTTRLAVLSDVSDHRLAELSRALTTRSDRTSLANVEYARAIARLTAAVDALRAKPSSSADKRSAAEDVVDAAHLKHEAILNELLKSAPAEAQDGFERAKREADELHASDRPARTPEPADRTDLTRPPQPTRTQTPRATEPARSDPTRTAPRPTPTR